MHNGCTEGLYVTWTIPDISRGVNRATGYLPVIPRTTILEMMLRG